jgi:hypothetical protein
LFVSDWGALGKNSVIYGIGIFGSKKVTTINVSIPIAGPADFIILYHELIVPAMINGEIHFIEIESDLSLKL